MSKSAWMASNRVIRARVKFQLLDLARSRRNLTAGHVNMQCIRKLARAGLSALVIVVLSACDATVDGEAAGTPDPGGDSPGGAETVGSPMPEPPSRSVGDGVYSEEQAGRGKVVYESQCATCHGDALLGGGVAPALVGAGVIEAWSGQSVGTLYASIRTTMPAGEPAALSPQHYIDIVAYLLQANGFPAGIRELSLEDRALLDRTVFGGTGES